MPQLTLYMRESCPYCQKVQSFLQEQKMTLSQKDIGQNARYREELIRLGGKQQVPCLVIDGKAMYESSDIIEWLGENWKK